jgi:polar amino acid transport system substrate-binding protein
MTVLALLCLFFSATPTRAELKHDVVYESVMKTGVIRCGYADWPPFIITDPVTKDVSGIMKDVMDEIGKRMGLKIEWAAAMGWGDITTAANSGKIDLFCNTVWPDKAQLHNMTLSRPLFYTPTYAYARADDKRFDNNYAAIDSPSVTIGGIDGDTSYVTMQDYFPHAHMMALPSESDMPQLLLSIVTRKADIMLGDPSVIKDYDRNNPGKIKQVKGKPLFLMSEILVTRAGEQQFMNALDTVLDLLINEGVIDRTLKKYGVTSSYVPKPAVDLPDMQGK